MYSLYSMLIFIYMATFLTFLGDVKKMLLSEPKANLPNTDISSFQPFFRQGFYFSDVLGVFCCFKTYAYLFHSIIFETPCICRHVNIHNVAVRINVCKQYI